MKFIQGQDRTQINLFPVSLDQSIDSENEVRIIDLFVDSLSIKDFGFRTDFIENGRPAYHPADLLKLFIYGYLNKVRSTRDLEKECRRNVEVMWLLKCLRPDHNTIAKSCKMCTAHSQCTRSKGGRVLSRSTYAEYYENNRKVYQEKEHLYKRRQAIVEHQYGTIKRQWGFSYILTKKGIARASADVGFIFIAYNLRRIGNILTGDLLKEYLRILVSLFLTICLHLRGIFMQYKRPVLLEKAIQEVKIGFA